MQLSQIKILKESKVRTVVSRALQHQRLGHAYLLYGPDGSGKEALALSMAQSFLCPNRTGAGASASLFGEEPHEHWACGACSNCHRVCELMHPDVHVVMPRASTAKEAEIGEVLQSYGRQPFHRNRPWENSFILIDDIRALKKTLAVTSYEGSGAVVLLLEAQRLKAESANALLKILEEPPPATHFVLTATSMESLLPTIVSRCQPLATPVLAQTVIASFLQEFQQIEPKRAAFIAKICNNNLRHALALVEENLEGTRNVAIEFLRMAFKFNRPLEQMDFLQQLLSERERQELQTLLKFCQLWIRDAYVLKACGENQQAEELIINTDFRNALVDLNKNLPDFDFDRVLTAIEFAIECLERHVQPWLVLMVLLHRIRQHARGVKS